MVTKCTRCGLTRPIVFNKTYRISKVSGLCGEPEEVPVRLCRPCFFMTVIPILHDLDESYIRRMAGQCNKG